MQEQINFFKVALSDFQIGAMARSSKYVVKAVVENFKGRSLRRVVEYGPGDGVVTKEILERMSPEGELIVIETNPEFLKILRNIKDSRLKVVKGTAQEVSRELNRDEIGFDLVISSIPFSVLDHADRENIVNNTFDMIKINGQFIIFHQYSPLMLGLLNKYFDDGNVKTQFEFRNFLPCLIMTAEKLKINKGAQLRY